MVRRTLLAVAVLMLLLVPVLAADCDGRALHRPAGPRQAAQVGMCPAGDPCDGSGEGR